MVKHSVVFLLSLCCVLCSISTAETTTLKGAVSRTGCSVADGDEMRIEALSGTIAFKSCTFHPGSRLVVSGLNSTAAGIAKSPIAISLSAFHKGSQFIVEDVSAAWLPYITIASTTFHNESSFIVRRSKVGQQNNKCSAIAVRITASGFHRESEIRFEHSRIQSHAIYHWQPYKHCPVYPSYALDITSSEFDPDSFGLILHSSNITASGSHWKMFAVYSFKGRRFPISFEGNPTLTFLRSAHASKGYALWAQPSDWIRINNANSTDHEARNDWTVATWPIHPVRLIGAVYIRSSPAALLDGLLLELTGHLWLYGLTVGSVVCVGGPGTAVYGMVVSGITFNSSSQPQYQQFVDAITTAQYDANQTAHALAPILVLGKGAASSMMLVRGSFSGNVHLGAVSGGMNLFRVSRVSLTNLTVANAGAIDVLNILNSTLTNWLIVNTNIPIGAQWELQHSTLRQSFKLTDSTFLGDSFVALRHVASAQTFEMRSTTIANYSTLLFDGVHFKRTNVWCKLNLNFITASSKITNNSVVEFRDSSMIAIATWHLYSYVHACYSSIATAFYVSSTILSHGSDLIFNNTRVMADSINHHRHGNNAQINRAVVLFVGARPDEPQPGRVLIVGSLLQVDNVHHALRITPPSAEYGQLAVQIRRSEDGTYTRMGGQVFVTGRLNPLLAGNEDRALKVDFTSPFIIYNGGVVLADCVVGPNGLMLLNSSITSGVGLYRIGLDAMGTQRTIDGADWKWVSFVFNQSQPNKYQRKRGTGNLFVSRFKGGPITIQTSDVESILVQNSTIGAVTLNGLGNTSSFLLRHSTMSSLSIKSTTFASPKCVEMLITDCSVGGTISITSSMFPPTSRLTFERTSASRVYLTSNTWKRSALMFRSCTFKVYQALCDTTGTLIVSGNKFLEGASMTLLQSTVYASAKFHRYDAYTICQTQTSKSMRLVNVMLEGSDTDPRLASRLEIIGSTITSYATDGTSYTQALLFENVAELGAETKRYPPIIAMNGRSRIRTWANCLGFGTTTSAHTLRGVQLAIRDCAIAGYTSIPVIKNATVLLDTSNWTHIPYLGQVGTTVGSEIMLRGNRASSGPFNATQLDNRVFSNETTLVEVPAGSCSLSWDCSGCATSVALEEQLPGSSPRCLCNATQHEDGGLDCNAADLNPLLAAGASGAYDCSQRAQGFMTLTPSSSLSPTQSASHTHTKPPVPTPTLTTTSTISRTVQGTTTVDDSMSVTSTESLTPTLELDTTPSHSLSVSPSLALTRQPAPTNRTAPGSSGEEPPQPGSDVQDSTRKILLNVLSPEGSDAVVGVGTSSVVVLAALGPVAPGQLLRTRQMSAIVDCSFSEAQDLEPSFIEHPIQLDFPVHAEDPEAPAITAFAGAIIGTVLLHLLLGALPNWAVAIALRNTPVTSWRRLKMFQSRLFSVAHSVFMSYFSVAAINGGTLILFHARHSDAIGTAVICMAAVLLDFFICGWLVTVKFFSFVTPTTPCAPDATGSKSSSSTSSEGDEISSSSKSPSTTNSASETATTVTISSRRGTVGGDLVKNITYNTARKSEDSDKSSAPQVERAALYFYEAFGELFSMAKAPTMPLRATFLEEIFVSMVISFLTGIRPTSGSCYRIGGAVLAISLLHFGFVVYYRPYRSKLEMFFCGFVAVLQLLFAVLALAAISDSSYTKPLAVLMIIINASFFIEVICLAVWAWIVSQRRRAMILIQKNDSEADDKDNDDDDEVEMRPKQSTANTTAGGSASTILAVPLLEDGNNSSKGRAGGSAKNPLYEHDPDNGI